MKQALSPAAAAALIPDGAVLMIGGFMGVGTPTRIIDALVAAGRRDLTVIANDTARPNSGSGKLVAAGLLSRVITSHIGLNPQTQKGMIDGTIQVELVEGLYAPPLRADFALIHADRADYNRNLAYQLTATNFNPVMAMAADTVICEPREILPVGMIPPDAVTTPGVIVDHLIERAA